MQSVLTVKQVTKVFNQFTKNWQQVQDDAVQFDAITRIYCDGIINKAPLEFIPFYVDEFYTKVAAMYDVVDTLEFGKMRSETQLLLHKPYISTSLTGGFLASAYEGERDIALSHCSHEGLKVHLKLMKNDLERRTDNHSDDIFVTTMDQIQNLENLISICSRDINMYRLKLISETRDALTSALHKSKNRRFCLNTKSYYMDGNYGCSEGFKCEYYKKPSGKEAEVKFKTLLYTVLNDAFIAGRDLYAEIRNQTIPAPAEFSHDELLASYAADLIALDAAKMETKKKLEANAEKQKTAKEKSKQILQARAAELATRAELEVSPEAELAAQQEAIAHDVYMRKLVDGVRIAGDTSDDDDESDAASSDSSINDHNDRDNHNGDKDSEECETYPQSLIKAHKKKRQNHDVSRDMSGVAANKKSHKKITPRNTTTSSQQSSSEYYSSTDSELSLHGDKSVKNVHSSRNNLRATKVKDRPTSTFLKPALSPMSLQSHSPGRVNTFRNTSMLEQVHSSVTQEMKQKARGRANHHMMDHSTVAEYDSSFPDLDGHPTNESLLHEIDESLVHADFSDNDAEFEDENDNTNVAWKRHPTNSEEVKRACLDKKRRKSRHADPEKVKQRQMSDAAADAKREAKQVEAKLRRDNVVFQRRVLEANNGKTKEVSANETGTSHTRKRRVTSGISASWTGFYGVNLALNQAQLSNSDLIKGCVDLVLGNASSSSSSALSSSSSSSSSSNITDADMNVVRSYRKQSGEVCDRVLKEKLMKHLQLEIFKEITFERLITEYSVAKREAAGVADDEIIDIDWFQVMDGFAVSLKYRLSVNSRIILARIHLAIDNDNTIVAKFAMKERFTTSMNAFLRHGNRTINSVVSKTVNKLGSHFDSLNFSDALPRFETYGKKTQGHAFSFTASLYNVFDENHTSALTSPANNTFGVDPLLCEIMKSTTDEKHMSDVIEYSLIKKSMYTDSPASYGALHKYLEKRKLTQITTTTSQSSSNKKHKNNDDVSKNSNSEDNEIIINPSTTITNESNNPSPLSQQQLLLSVIDLTGSSTATQLATIDNNNVNKNLFQDSEYQDSPGCQSRSEKSTPTPAASTRSPGVRGKSSSITNENVEIFDDTPPNSNKPNNMPHMTEKVVTKGIKDFLQMLLSDVKSSDNNLFLKLNTRHNIRKTSNLSFMKFIETNVHLDDVAFYDTFCSSPYFATLSCVLFIPFDLNDQFNVIGDGYCYYRSLFMLLLREQSGFNLTADQLRELDGLLKAVGENGELLRAQFLDFFSRIEQLFPDKTAKAKAAAAGCTFSHLSTYLDQRFWGGSDSVPFLDYNCTAFSHNKEENATLRGCWAKMFSSSVPGLVNGRETLDFNTVGDAYSLHDILQVLMRPHNWLLHKQVHFFLGDHPDVQTFLKSFAGNLSTMIIAIRERVIASKREHPSTNFSDVYDRMVQGTSSVEDVLWLSEMKTTLEKQLTDINVVYEEDTHAETVSSTPPVKQMECFLATPFGATQEQKIYISTINNTVAMKEYENELLRTQLAGLKEMIARNSAAAQYPVFIDCTE